MKTLKVGNITIDKAIAQGGMGASGCFLGTRFISTYECGSSETFKQAGNTYKITFGSPISYQTLISENDQDFLAQKIRAYIINLKNNLKIKFL
jgi:NAD(P)H-dependent flavin oxidoreductase YrpB (nitropropane dioxygenase family)